MAKNPNRVAAGRANRALRGSLSAESRQLLREAALVNRPWLHSTGPRTEAGKKRGATNARKKPDRRKETPATDPTTAHALALLKQMTALRKGFYLDVDSIRIEQGDAVAEQLREIIVGASRSITRELAGDLLGAYSDPRQLH